MNALKSNAEKTRRKVAGQEVAQEGKTPIRLNLAITQKVKEQLEEVQELSDAASLAEVVRKALAVYHMLIDHRADGGSVVLKYANGNEEKIVIV